MTCAEEPKNIVNRLNVMPMSGQTDLLKGKWTLDDAKISILLNNKIMKSGSNKYTRRPVVGKKEMNVDQEQTFRIVRIF